MHNRWVYHTTAAWLVAMTAIAIASAACGGDDSEGIDEMPDSGVMIDAAILPTDSGTVPIDADEGHNGDCEMGGMASASRYYPFEVGNQWRYRVDDYSGQDPTVKRNELTMAMTPDADTGEVIVQSTTKSKGTTVSWLQRKGDAVYRLRQQDLDLNGNLERTTYYIPHRLRLDESTEHLEPGVSWSDDFIRRVEDPAGVITKEEAVSELWTVLGIDVPCGTPWGERACLHVSRARIIGGQSYKEYYFARGLGKVREEGGVVEELIGCNLR